MTLGRTWRLAVAICLAAGAPAVLAQDDDLYDPMVLPVEDLQGVLHMSDEDVVDILSTRSLMLSDREVALIEDAKRLAAERDAELDAIVDATADATMVEPLEARDFRLEAILYVSPEQWTFWLNGEAIGPKAIPRDLTVRRVTPALVEISWLPDPTLPHDVRTFTLEPGQVYVADTAEVMEAADYLGPSSLSAASEADGGEPADEDEGEDEDEDEDETSETEAATDVVEPADEQRARLEELQRALGVVAGNAAALGMTEEELADLRAGLAAAGDIGSLSPEQQAQLRRIQQATGMEP